MLRTADELIRPALEATLAELKLQDGDVALVELARRYADVLDAGDGLARHVERAWEELDPEDQDARRRLAFLEAQLADVTVLTQLGPKLLAVLQALGATPAARAARREGVASGGPNRLQALRDARRA